MARRTTLSRRRRGLSHDRAIKIQTIHGSEGLQYKAVIVLWADRLAWTFPVIDPAEDPKLIYVALTRAEDYLFITRSEPSSFLDRMRQSGKVAVS